MGHGSNKEEIRTEVIKNLEFGMTQLITMQRLAVFSVNFRMSLNESLGRQ